jgi:hypothetical protein
MFTSRVGGLGVGPAEEKGCLEAGVSAWPQEITHKIAILLNIFIFYP